MAEIKVIDGNGDQQWVEVVGDGTQGIPFRIKGANAEAVLTALQAIQAATTATNTVLSTLGGYQDGVEALIGTTNTNLTTLAGYTDTLETLVAATNTALSTVANYVDGLEGGIGTSTDSPATGTSNGTAIALLKQLRAQLAGNLAVTGTFWQTTQPISASTLPLPSGATTEATLSAINNKTPALGQALAAAAVPVVFTAIQQAALTPPPAITGYATESTLGTMLTAGTSITGQALESGGSNALGWLSSIRKAITDRLPASLTGSGNLKVAIVENTANSDPATGTGIGSVTETAPTTDIASSGLNGRLQRIAQRLTSLIALLAKPSTGTSSNVASSATNVTLLMANASRLGATIYNDSTATLYLRLGATASATSHSIQIATGGYYEVPYGYTGIIDGIWAVANGSARVTELT